MDSGTTTGTNKLPSILRDNSGPRISLGRTPQLLRARPVWTVPSILEAIWLASGRHGGRLGFPVEDRFGLGRRDMPDRRQQSSMVEPVDPAEGGQFDCREVLPGLSVDHLDLVDAVDGLGQSIVVNVPDAAHLGLDARFAEPLGVADRQVVAAAVAVMGQAVGLGGRPARLEGLLEGVEHERGMCRAGDLPADDATRVGVDDEGDVDEALPKGDVDQVRDPQPVRAHDLRVGNSGNSCAAKPVQPVTKHHAFASWALWLLLLLSPVLQAGDTLGQRARYGVPMSCAALAQILGADYPEAVRVYDEGHEPLSFAEADRAALGLLWRHRQQFAEDVAAQAFAELFGKPVTNDNLRAGRSRWVHKLMSYPEPLREAVAMNCEVLFEVADRSCPMPRGAEP